MAPDRITSPNEVVPDVTIADGSPPPARVAPQTEAAIRQGTLRGRNLQRFQHIEWTPRERRCCLAGTAAVVTPIAACIITGAYLWAINQDLCDRGHEDCSHKALMAGKVTVGIGLSVVAIPVLIIFCLVCCLSN
jgi:hypothetical protein